MKKKNSIAFVYPDFFKPVTGGHIYERDLVETLKNNNDLSVEVIYRNSNKNIFTKLLAPISGIGLYKTLKKRDLIVFNSTKGFYQIPLQWFLRLMGKKTLVIHHHFLHLEFKGLKRWLYWYMEKTFLKGASHVLTPSPYIASIIETRLKRSYVINEIPFNKQVTDVNSDRIPGQLLYVGTIEERKGLKYLFEALSTLTRDNIPYTLHIVGKIKDQLYYNNLIEMKSRYNLPVIFHGYASNEELENLYNTSELFVFPSLLEGFGMAINEAMCHGLPVIAFDNSAMPYSINSNNGVLVPDRDSQHMAQAISSLLLNKSELDRLSQGAKEYTTHLPDKTSFQAKSNEIFSKLCLDNA